MSCIGPTRRNGTILLPQFGLAPFRAILPPEVFLRAAEEGGCAPQRDRPLIPEVVAWLMMYVALQTASMTQGLAQAWGLVRAICPALKERGVSEEAFCQARNQWTLRFWRALWENLVMVFEAKFAAALRWKGIWRVVAIDGSDLDLPNVPAVVRFFGKPGAVGGNAQRPQGKLVALCSVFTGFCFAFKLLPKRFSEHAAVQHLLRRLRPRDLVLMDKGFFFVQHPSPDSPARCGFPAAIAGVGRGLRPPRGAVGRPQLVGRIPPFSLLASERPHAAGNPHRPSDSLPDPRFSSQPPSDVLARPRGIPHT